MRVIKQTEQALALATSQNFNAYNLDNLQGYSIVANVANQVGVNATLKIQISNNAFLDNVNNNADPNAHWVDLPGSTYTVTGNGDFSWNVTDAYYNAFRVVWTRTGGTADVSLFIRAKGVI